MRIKYGPVDQYLNDSVSESLNRAESADILKSTQRQAVYEWEKTRELQSLEDSALSNRDKRHNKFPKFKRRM